MFSWWAIGFIALGGAMGTLIRDALNRAIPFSPETGSFPRATAMVNVAGCFIIGFLGGWLSDERLQWFWLIGVCGGMTTFSTLQWESWALWRHGYRKQALLAFAVNYGIGLAVAGLGWWLSV